VRIIADWPGKSDINGNRHPAVWHMIDVGAVASRLIRGGPFASLPASQRQALVFLIALHDIGKITEAFRAQIELGRSPPANCRHWQLSARLLSRLDHQVSELIGGQKEVRGILFNAIAGHHGRPPVTGFHIEATQDEAIGKKAEIAATEVLSALAPLFDGASLDGIGEHVARRLSWYLSGLTVQADWIGSNSDWFPFMPPTIPLSNYWSHAQNCAMTAISAAAAVLSGQCKMRPSPPICRRGPLSHWSRMLQGQERPRPHSSWPTE
jgi:CRISPR-associated endonuclease/helicase Cas3